MGAMTKTDTLKTFLQARQNLLVEKNQIEQRLQQINQAMEDRQRPCDCCVQVRRLHPSLSNRSAR